MADALDYIQTLQEAIRKTYGCESIHHASVPTEEVVKGKTVWRGTVEVFELEGHPEAKCAYAWGHAERSAGIEVRLVTILGVPPVISPRKAVQASIAADARGG